MDKWQLIDFLGDENDIDDVDYRAQFDFSLNEEETTMLTGVVMDNFDYLLIKMDKHNKGVRMVDEPCIRRACSWPFKQTRCKDNI